MLMGKLALAHATLGACPSHHMTSQVVPASLRTVIMKLRFMLLCIP